MRPALLRMQVVESGRAQQLVRGVEHGQLHAGVAVELRGRRAERRTAACALTPGSERAAKRSDPRISVPLASGTAFSRTAPRGRSRTRRVSGPAEGASLHPLDDLGAQLDGIPQAALIGEAERPGAAAAHRLEDLLAPLRQALQADLTRVQDLVVAEPEAGPRMSALVATRTMPGGLAEAWPAGRTPPAPGARAAAAARRVRGRIRRRTGSASRCRGRQAVPAAPGSSGSRRCCRGCAPLPVGRLVLAASATWMPARVLPDRTLKATLAPRRATPRPAGIAP